MEDQSKVQKYLNCFSSRNAVSRIVMLFCDITDNVSAEVTSSFLELQKMDPLSDITLMINSNGGEIDEMFSIIDIMNIITPAIKTVVIGKAMSAGAFIAICGKKGKRYITENSRLMLHSVSGGIAGNIKDVQIDIKELQRLNDKIIQMISNNSNLSIDEVKELIDRDRYILPDEAIKLGLIDEIITSLK